MSDSEPTRATLVCTASAIAIKSSTRPLLQIRRGRAEAHDAVSLTPCLAGIAETGTLLLASGPGTPSTLNFLPDTHIVVLHAGQVVASYEDGWDLLRAVRQDDPPPLVREVDRPTGGPEGATASPLLPRTVNLITGPSRTGDIEQRIQLGAHGPRRLHVILVEDAPAQP